MITTAAITIRIGTIGRDEGAVELTSGGAMVVMVATGVSATVASVGTGVMGVAVVAIVRPVTDITSCRVLVPLPWLLVAVSTTVYVPDPR